MKGEGNRAADAAAVVNGLRAALEQDELPVPIGRALASCEDGIFSWLAEAPRPRRVLRPSQSRRWCRAPRPGVPAGQAERETETSWTSCKPS